MTKTFLIPKRGLRLRDPKTLQPLPPEGAEVEMTSYWRRRLNDGDVTAADPPTRTANKKSDKHAASRGAQE